MATILDFILMSTGCWLIGGEFSTTLGWAMWLICIAFYKGHDHADN
jgi:hypothetical protein